MKSHLTKPHHSYNNLDLGHTPAIYEGQRPRTALRSVRGIMTDDLAFDLLISFCILFTNEARPDLITLTLLRLISSAPLQNSTIDDLILSH